MPTWFDARRSPVRARNGMVATSQPLAAIVGLRTLMAGGNAVDAAVATAAALAVVEPMSTGLGGDLFALVWDAPEKRVLAINGSGRSPAASSLEELQRQGLSEIPVESPYAVTVPGTVDAWQALLEKSGTMSLADVLQPAIQYAEEGFPVTDVIGRAWASGVPKLAKRPSGQELLSNGAAPKPGDLMRLPQLAESLRAIAEGGRDAFYNGPIAEKMARYVQEEGGWLSADDMATHTSDWVEPISTDYRGIRVWECPPNGQGINVLLGLNILEGFDIESMGHQSPETYHHLIEATRLAMADGFRYITDPLAEHIPTTELLSGPYAWQRRSQIQPYRALQNVEAGKFPPMGNTVYITVVDGQGNACSLMNSIFRGFGTGLVVPGTGIVLHCRGILFSLDPAHPNHLAPRKRTFHTIIPSMTTRDGELWASFGVMGALQQAQGQIQVLTNMIDFGQGPQEALNALRYRTRPGKATAVEEGIPLETYNGLEQRGHSLELVAGPRRTLFGKGQIIVRDPDTGVLTAGSEPRSDGAAVGW